MNINLIWKKLSRKLYKTSLRTAVIFKIVLGMPLKRPLAFKMMNDSINNTLIFKGKFKNKDCLY